jgi:hypothetical protein
MRFDLTHYSTAQQLALLDLLILAMYTDGHLSVWEEAWLQELMAGMGFQEEATRQREFDEAVARTRPSTKNIVQARDHALKLADFFTQRDQQKKVYDTVQWIMGSDGHVSTWETMLLSELRMKFRV